ncbi:hypothetical protein Tco_0841711 [Tanacetum coccineum]|uniref:Rho termination factor N-terminal domain-containing protein n=1 Tax=Tanacetum coccineum TaxID=301880 RepID=A0ABQ5AYZ6_9ASTR
MYKLNEEQIQAHLDKEEVLEKAAREAKLSKPELIKVVYEEATKARVDPKALSSKKGGQEFVKMQDAKIKVHNKEHSKKIKRAEELRQERIDLPESGSGIIQRITKQWQRNKPAEYQVFYLWNTGFFTSGIPQSDRGIQVKPGEIQVQELKPEVRIPGLKCNRSLHKGILFVNNLIIEQPEYEMFFIDVFGDEAFQRMNDIHKIDADTLLTYLLIALNINNPTNQRFCLALRSLIDSHHHKEKLKSKRVKLKAVGY